LRIRGSPNRPFFGTPRTRRSADLARLWRVIRPDWPQRRLPRRFAQTFTEWGARQSGRDSEYYRRQGDLSIVILLRHLCEIPVKVRSHRWRLLDRWRFYFTKSRRARRRDNSFSWFLIVRTASGATPASHTRDGSASVSTNARISRHARCARRPRYGTRTTCNTRTTPQCSPWDANVRNTWKKTT